MRKILLIIICSFVLLAGCKGKDILGDKPESTTPPPSVNEDVVIGDIETFGEYTEDGVLGMFISRTDSELKMKCKGEIVTIKIPEGFPEKMFPEALVKDKVFIAHCNEKNGERVLDYIEIITSMR